jgi:hypothetical protein
VYQELVLLLNQVPGISITTRFAHPRFVPLYTGTDLYRELVPLYTGTDLYRELVPLYTGTEFVPGTSTTI